MKTSAAAPRILVMHSCIFHSASGRVRSTSPSRDALLKSLHPRVTHYRKRTRRRRLVPISHWNLPSIWALLHSEGVRTRSSNSTPQRIARRAEGQESQQAPYSAEAHAKTSVDTSHVAICHLPPNCAPEAWLVAQGSLAASSSLLLQCTPH